MKISPKTVKFGAREIALVAIMAATIECGKLVLSFLPNIEVVTLLCALYGYVFGIYGVVAAAVFVCIEPLIYGFGSWFITYLIFWPAVAFIFMLLGKKQMKNRLILALIAVGLSIIFGMLSSVIDSAFLFGINEFYFKNMIIYYLRGLSFDAVHILSNTVVFLTIYPFLVRKLGDIRKTYEI